MSKWRNRGPLTPRKWIRKQSRSLSLKQNKMKSPKNEDHILKSQWDYLNIPKNDRVYQKILCTEQNSRWNSQGKSSDSNVLMPLKNLWEKWTWWSFRVWNIWNISSGGELLNQLRQIPEEKSGWWPSGVRGEIIMGVWTVTT